MNLLGIIDSALDVGKSVWDIYAQNKTWDREDTAIQRRVADLRAAGLSPTLAAGSAAQTSSPISINKAQPGADYSAQVEVAKTLMQQDANISATRAQEDYTRRQSEKLYLENEPLRYLLSPNKHLLDGQWGDVPIAQSWAERSWEARKAEWETMAANAREAEARANKAELEESESRRNYGIAQRQGIRSDLSGIGESMMTGDVITKMLGLSNKASPAASALTNLFGKIAPILLQRSLR